MDSERPRGAPPRSESSSVGRSTSARRARVVVVDDHPFFRDGLTRGLKQSGYLDVVGEAESGHEGLDLIRRELPDVAVLDYQMPDLDGLAVVQAIVRDGLPTKALLLSALTDSALVYRALELGAKGYLAKEAKRSEIVDAVLQVARGGTVVPAGARGRPGRADPAAGRDVRRRADRARAAGAAGIRKGPVDPGSWPPSSTSAPAR